MRICDAAIEVLRETNNPAVGYGDSGLLHMIAERARKPHRGWITEENIIVALDRTPGLLVKGYFRTPHWNRLARVFYLPECAPNPKEAEA